MVQMLARTSLPLGTPANAIRFPSGEYSGLPTPPRKLPNTSRRRSLPWIPTVAIELRSSTTIRPPLGEKEGSTREEEARNPRRMIWCWCRPSARMVQIASFESSPRTKTIRRPSADQAGDVSRRPLWVSWVGSPPDGGIVKISIRAALLECSDPE